MAGIFELRANCETQIEIMLILETDILNIEEKMIIYEMWNNEYPENLSFNTIHELNNYLITLLNLTYFLLKNSLNKIEGWAMKLQWQMRNGSLLP